jgi:hypothetical protein
LDTSLPFKPGRIFVSEEIFMINVEAAKRSWRVRRRIKRIIFGWLLLTFFLAEAGASWFGILIATHAPMSIAEAKLIGERTAAAVILISFAALIISVILQFRARRTLRRLENIRLQSVTA